MLDIYNDLGIGYQINSDLIKNLYDVYVKIYYFVISQEDLKNNGGFNNVFELFIDLKGKENF